MDDHLLLTAVQLQLDPEVRSGKSYHGVFTVKNPCTHAYLRVTQADWAVLVQFATPIKVPDALRRMLEERTCPALRDFYEVVLKAHRVGILRHEAPTSSAPHPVRWFGIGSGWPVKFSLLVNAAALALIFVPGWMPSLQPLDLLKGWAVLSGVLSLGQILAAAVVAGGECKVYRPHLAWRTLTPHLAFDLRDAGMGGHGLQLAVPMASILPTALAVAVVTWAVPAWSLPLVVGWLWQVRPIAGGACSEVFELLLGRLRPDTKRDYLFGPNQGLYARRRAAVRSTPAIVALASMIYGLVWTAVVVAYAAKSLGYLPVEGWLEPSFLLEAAQVFAIWLAIVGAALVLLEVIWWLWRRGRSLRGRVQVCWRRRSFALTTALDEDALVARLLRSPLFRRLSPEQQHEVARHMDVRQVPAGTTLFDFDDTPVVVGLIISGEIKQHRRGPTGHIESIGTLNEDELFGVHRIADAKRRVRARSRTRLWYVAMTMPDFQRLVVERLGVPAVEQSGVRHPFLRRLSLCEHWHPQALARFVQLTTSLDCAEGDLIIRKGEDTLDLYIVQEGKVEVLVSKRRRRVLGPGSFFGEIGLLQNSVIVADVKARTSARCLAINKRDFLRFMTHNPSVGLQVERISSERLGRPIFPLSRQSFDIR